MVRNIVYFARLLRKAGIRVAPSEIQDCLKAVQLMGFDKAEFKEVLRASLVKQQEDDHVFEKIFYFYFAAAGNRMSGSSRGEKGSVELSEKTHSREGKGLGKSGAGGPAPDLLSAVDSGDGEVLEETARNAVELLGELSPEDINNLREKKHRAKVELEWFMALHKMDKMLDEGEINYYTYVKWQQRISLIEEKIDRVLKEKYIYNYGEWALERIAAAENTGETDFMNLDPGEMRCMKEKVNRLGRQLAVKKSRRYRRATRGQVDIKKVVKIAGGYGGVPLKLAFKKRKYESPELVLLCDISNSVSRYSTFMIQLAYAAQHCFKYVHCFVFVDHLSYVSPLFKNISPERALVEMKFLSKISETGYSHFGRVFSEFYHNYLSTINEKSTVIILGDAKNNWRYPGVDYLREMARRCEKFYWLNPLPEYKWEKEDCLMNLYGPLCSGVYECRNMNQLEKVAQRIF